MTYYLKYRPQFLEELDSSGARESLKKIISSSKIPHALLFYGPKGTGKTSAARILAKIINCERLGKNVGKVKNIEPCNKCEQCLTISKGSNIDVIEMDAASHRGIDDARFLKDAVKLAPAKARKKVYVIDEAHMLTTEASNALLKTIEEPPEHVVFILATTNPEKLISTIRSRCVEIPFKKATLEEVVRSLGKIVKGEKIKLDKDSLELIAKAANGSFRDSAKILEQAVTEGVTKKTQLLQKYLSGKSFNAVDNFLLHLNNLDIRMVIEDIEGVVADGASVEDFITEILDKLRSVLLAKAGIGETSLMQERGKEEIIYLIELLLKARELVGSTYLEQLPLEVAVIKWCSEKNSMKENVKIEEEKTENKEVSDMTKKVETMGKLPKKKAVRNSESNSPALEINKEVKPFSEENWQKILSLIKPLNTSVEALLKAAKPLAFDGKTLTLAVYYRFHKERLEEEKYRKILEGIVSQVLSIESSRVICTLVEPPKKAEVKPETVLTEPEAPLTQGEGEDIIEIAKKIFS
jgi:DNA polymerase-3 subunit gamma/tau